MSSKDMNSTIITVAVVAIGGFAAWKWLSKPAKAAAATYGTPVGSGGDSYDPYGSDYYAPDNQQQSLSSSLGQFLNSLFGGSGKGSSSGGGSGSGASRQNPNYPSQAGNPSSDYYSALDSTFAQSEGDLINAQTQDLTSLYQNSDLLGVDIPLESTDLGSVDLGQGNPISGSYDDSSSNIPDYSYLGDGMSSGGDSGGNDWG